MGLVSLDDVKLELGIITTEYDALLNRYIETISNIVEKYIGYSLHLEVILNEAYAGTNSPFLILRKSPVISVEEVKINGITLDASEYSIKQNILYRESLWPRKQFINPITQTPHGKNVLYNIFVSYTAGYATIPADIQTVVIDEVKEKYNNFLSKTNKFVTGEKILDVQKTYSNANIDTETGLLISTINVLNKYKEVVI